MHVSERVRKISSRPHSPFKAAIESAEAWEQFLRMLKRRGKARITVTSVLNFDGKVAGRFEGEFVALGATGAQPIISPGVA